MKHAISWFEIPSKDLERATKFYESIFDIKLIAMDFPNLKMRTFPTENGLGISGALIYTSNDFYACSDSAGPLLYLNANPDVQNVLDKVEDAGGSILVPKTEISSDFGAMAVIKDTEGNRIALHNIPG